jgi:hypothetical protein
MGKLFHSNRIDPPVSCVVKLSNARHGRLCVSWTPCSRPVPESLMVQMLLQSLVAADELR